MTTERPLLIVACAWCKDPTPVIAGVDNYCEHCGHRADVAPVGCDCGRCEVGV